MGRVCKQSRKLTYLFSSHKGFCQLTKAADKLTNFDIYGKRTIAQSMHVTAQHFLQFGFRVFFPFPLVPLSHAPQLLLPRLQVPSPRLVFLLFSVFQCGLPWPSPCQRRRVRLAQLSVCFRCIMLPFPRILSSFYALDVYIIMVLFFALKKIVMSFYARISMSFNAIL